MFLKREGIVIGGFGGEEVGVLRPVKLARSKDAKTAARDTLVQDVIDLMGEAEARRVVDLARDLMAFPMHADTSEDALGKAIKRTFEAGVKDDKNDNYTIQNRSVKGIPGRSVVVLRTNGQAPKRDVCETK